MKITLAVLALLAWLAPVSPIDPWNLLSPQKIAKMIFALAMIQALGTVAAQYLGHRVGSILTGFLGGLVSSTATTASLARRSRVDDQANVVREMLIFLSATGAMLFEGLVLVVAGSTEIRFSTLLIFIGPILMTLALIFIYSKKLTIRRDSSSTSTFHILPILKLTLFIVVILSVSKLFQNFFGQNGLLVLTSLVSLFEIHGSIISNVQLHESGSINTGFLSSLLAISVFASYLSKIFLISTLGSRRLKASVVKNTMMLFATLAVSWMAAISLS